MPHAGRILIVTSVLPRVFGGRTKSLLQRARIFSARGLDVTVMSTNQDDDWQEVCELYRSRGYVDDKIVLHNMFEAMAGFDASSRGSVEQLLSAADGQAVAKSVDVSVQLRPMSASGEPGARRSVDLRVEHGDAGAVTATAVINKLQNVTRLKYRDSAGRVVFEDYLDRDVRPFLRYRRVGDKKTFASIRDGGRGPFISYKRLIADYLNSIIRDDDVVINDARGLDYPVRLIERPVRKIYVMHNPHLADPLDDRSGVKNSFKSILRAEGLLQNETIVSLTEDQRQSILARLPVLENNIAVIGHPSHSPRLRWRWSGSTRRVGIVGRLDEQKNLGDAILAFQAFHRIFPRYELVIYGRGLEEAPLRKIVKDLGMEQCVSFKGFTHDVDAAFQSVDFTLNTSFYEGFPLAIIESISNGVPVASYPVNFGPKAILGRGAGRISAKRTPESLAIEMVALALRRPARKYVRNLSREFSEEDYFRKWSSLIRGQRSGL